MSTPSHLFGLHDPGGEFLFREAGKSGWVTVTVKVSPPDSNGDFSSLADAGLGVIARLNHGYGGEGTLPPAAEYDRFARDCAAYVAGSRGAARWIIGNETNLAAERPGNSGGQGGEPITPANYGRCFAQCRRAIRSLPGHDQDWVIPAAPGPWNNETAYTGNPAGDWVQYFQDLLSACLQAGEPPDALALHTYTHGFDAGLLASEGKMDPPFERRHFHFRAYRDFVQSVPAALRDRPVLITETQPVPWENRDVGWIQAAYAEINAWNSMPANQPIQAVCLFRWQHNTGDPAGWSISDKPRLIDDLRGALQNNYLLRLPQPSIPVTPATPSGPPPGAPGSVTVYVVQPGDTLSAIAKRFGATVAAIATANGISNPSLIRVGQRLQIPAARGLAGEASFELQAPTPAAAPAPLRPATFLFYRVRRGDTLVKIARRFGVTPETLTALNELGDSAVKPGQTLAVPAFD